MNGISKFLWVGAVALGLSGFTQSASAGVDVYVGVGSPGVVYYDDWRPAYREYYYSAPRPVYHYYDRRPVYNHYYYHRDNGRHRHPHHDHRHRHDHGHRGDDRRRSWRDDNRRRYGHRD